MNSLIIYGPLLVILRCAEGMPTWAISLSSSVASRFRGGSSEEDLIVGGCWGSLFSRSLLSLSLSRSRSRSLSRSISRCSLSFCIAFRDASSIRFVASSMARCAASIARASRSAMLRRCDVWDVGRAGGPSSSTVEKTIKYS